MRCLFATKSVKKPGHFSVNRTKVLSLASDDKNMATEGSHPVHLMVDIVWAAKHGVCWRAKLGGHSGGRLPETNVRRSLVTVDVFAFSCLNYAWA